MRNRNCLILLLLLIPLALVAQRRGVPAKRVVKAEKPKTDLHLFKQMLPATAKVMFIDSVVVDKANFLSRVPLNSESGSLKVTNAKVDFNNQMSAYQNELGLRRIYASGDSAKSVLYTQTLLGDKWGRGSEIVDFDEEIYPKQNYPFLSSDGVTLYFSAEGKESMGGRDIFMSSFDSDAASWYKPQNLGLPFNSTANDYLLAIDDLDTLGWLVTDRRQPEGKVCIYTFVPTQTRQNFDDDDLDDDELMPYARITSIKETWKFGNRERAIKRRDAMLKRLNKKTGNANSMFFVIDDNTVITSPQQFKNSESRTLYSQIQEIVKMNDTTKKQLNSQRQAFHNGDKTVSDSILKLEQEYEQQQRDIHSLEKKIRELEKK